MEWINKQIEFFEDLSDRISRIPDEINRVVEENKEILLTLNKDQLLSGRNTDGELLLPGYLEDPYFKTKKQAEWYAGMKYNLEGIHNARIHNLQIYPSKPRNTPNLIITGAMQDKMFIAVSNGSYMIDSTYMDTQDISDKYNGKIFGLAPASRQFFYSHYLQKQLINFLWLAKEKLK